MLVGGRALLSPTPLFGCLSVCFHPEKGTSTKHGAVRSEARRTLGRGSVRFAMSKKQSCSHPIGTFNMHQGGRAEGLVGSRPVCSKQVRSYGLADFSGKAKEASLPSEPDLTRTTHNRHLKLCRGHAHCESHIRQMAHTQSNATKSILAPFGQILMRSLLVMQREDSSSHPNPLNPLGTSDFATTGLAPMCDAHLEANRPAGLCSPRTQLSEGLGAN